MNKISESGTLRDHVTTTSAHDSVLEKPSSSDDSNANESDSDANKSDSDVYFKSDDSDSNDEHESHHLFGNCLLSQSDEVKR